MGNCKVCGEETDTVFNIDFNAVHICESCATRIFVQQALWYSKGEHTGPKKVIGVVSQSVMEFYAWAREQQRKHPNEFRFKFKGRTRAFNAKSNTEYICVSTLEHTCGYAFNNFIELDEARQNKDFEKIMDGLIPCLKGLSANEIRSHYKTLKGNKNG